ncbi:MAG: C/D box methylation guide ribonucleoprotein complex aNOP56 subunit [Promethearchaeota archaeon]
MDGVLVVSFHGVCCIDEHLNIITRLRFSDEVDEAIASIERILSGEKEPVLVEFFALLAEKNITRLLVESRQLAEELARIYGIKTVYSEDVSLWRNVRSKLLTQLVTSKHRRRLREIALEISRHAIREASERRDQLIIQAMSTLDEIERTLNLFISRLREYYGLHFPEAAQHLENALNFALLVAEGGQRNSIHENPELLAILPKRVRKNLTEQQSMGAEIGAFDMAIIQKLAQQYLNLHNFREQLEKYLDKAMQEEALNLRGLVGPILGARLISSAGSIEKLARLPASTIQILGAEKALFRALKTGARPPKHGVIFQHTLVHSAPWWQRGKIARVLAGKIAIAARIDMYGGQYLAEELKQDVIKRIEEIKRKYPTGPQERKSEREPRRQQQTQSRRKRYSQKTVPKRRRGTRSKGRRTEQ